MRIDLNSGIVQASDPAALSKSNPQSSSQAAKGEAPSDVANLSNTYGRLQELTGMINSQAEMRQEKVAALTAMVQNGTYRCSPEQTAEALLAHMANT